MNPIKKIFSIILITAISFTIYTGSAAAATSVTDINTMAAALNRLNILQGNNGDYLLNNKIKRSEAAALIIRMLGKENFVNQNAEQLKNTKFADVPAKEWYAKYVGYCTQYNIMGGYPDGRFAPNDNVSEKSFIKMALCALGYVYNTDFDWSNVYQKAYLAGIVTDPVYISKTQDNANYLRSEVVRVIYSSLNAMKKGTATKMIFALADEGAFTRDVISASGVLGADKPTEIDLVTATSFNSIEINLNENIQGVNAADITITDASTTAAAVTAGALTVQSVAVSNDRIQVITSGQTPNKNYLLKIRSVTDAQGNISGQLSSTFKGFYKQQVASDFFKISKVEQTAANVLNVYFTHPVGSNSESASYYELNKNGNVFVSGSSQNITVKKLPSSNNAVSIYLKSAKFTQGEVYSLKVSGKFSSSYGVKLGEGYGESMEFVTSAADAGEFAVSSVYAWSSTSVYLVFNRDVDTGWAEKFLNYTIYDTNKSAITVTKAVKTGSGDAGGRTIMLTLASPLDRTKQYEVRIEYVPDLYKQSTIEGKIFPFSGAYPENTDLAISQAASDYINSVVLIFNRPLDATIAANTASYSIRGITDPSFNVVPVKAYYDDTYGKYAVKLYLPAGKNLSNSQKYTVQVAGLRDSSGTAQPLLLRSDFTGGSYSAVKPQIADAVMISKDAVKLTFSLEVAFNVNNINTSNYSLEYVENGETIKNQPIGVTYVDARTIVLRFDGLDPSKTYQVKFASIDDYSGVYTRNAAEGSNSATVRQGK